MSYRSSSHHHKSDAAAHSFSLFWFGHVLPTMTPREKLRTVMNNSLFGNWWSLLQLVVTIYACAQYVADTYDLSFQYAQTLDFVVSIFFLLDYILSWYAATDRLTYPFGFMPIVDLLTILPSFLPLAGGSSATEFFRVLRVVRSLRILRSFRLIGDNMRPSRRALAELALMCLCSLFIFATLFQLVETQYYAQITQQSDPLAVNPLHVSFGDAVYMGVIVLCTVGYGDIYPMTFWGKIAVSLLIVFTISMFMAKLTHFGSALFERERERERESRRYP